MLNWIKKHQDLLLTTLAVLCALCGLINMMNPQTRKAFNDMNNQFAQIDTQPVNVMKNDN